MTTNRERLNHLREKIKVMNDDLHKRGFEEKYISLAKQLASHQIEPVIVTEEMWDIMLPMEQEKNLLWHYHTLRSELQIMMDKIKTTPMEKISQWLEKPWVKFGITATAIIQLAIDIISIAHQSGLFFVEDDDNSII